MKIVDTFPEDTHTPIVYPIAVTTVSKNPEAPAFEAYMNGPEATKILTDQGFTVLKK